MGVTLQEKLGTLVVDRCWCGIQHAIPESLYNEQNNQHDNGEQQVDIFCPLGHSYVLRGKSKVTQLSAQLVQEKASHDQTKAALRNTEARRRAQKGVNTRLKDHISKGVCPCCKRSFVNLRRHMEQKHPNYAEKAK